MAEMKLEPLRRETRRAGRLAQLNRARGQSPPSEPPEGAGPAGETDSRLPASRSVGR